MRILYTFTDINKKGMLYGIGDLMKYYADISMGIDEELENLKKEKGKRLRYVNHILRKSTGNAGITLNSMLETIETFKNQGSFFSFKLNDEQICDFVSKDKVKLEVYMNEYYFIGSLMLSQIIPQFSFTTKYPKTIEGEKQKWMDWFEMNWKKKKKYKGFDNPNFKREIKEW